MGLWNFRSVGSMNNSSAKHEVPYYIYSAGNIRLTSYFFKLLTGYKWGIAVSHESHEPFTRDYPDSASRREKGSGQGSYFPSASLRAGSAHTSTVLRLRSGQGSYFDRLSMTLSFVPGFAFLPLLLPLQPPHAHRSSLFASIPQPPVSSIRLAVKCSCPDRGWFFFSLPWQPFPIFVRLTDR